MPILTVFLFAGAASASVVTGDLNGDGQPEILSAAGDGGITVFMAAGAGVYGSSGTILSGKHAGEMRLLDLNGDTRLDLLVTLPDDSSAQTHWGNGDGTFTLSQTHSLDGQPVSLALFDIGGDGGLDLAVGLDNNRVQVFQDAGAGIFTDLLTVDTSSKPEMLLGIHTDADAWTDLVYAQRGADSLSVLQNNVVIEPPAIVSSSHPNPCYTYLDGSASFEFQGAPRAAFYYLLLDEAASTFPEASGASAQLAGQPYTVSGLTDGTWYLHAISSTSGGRTGNLVNHFPISIDKTLTSSSHPSSSEWSKDDVFSMEWLTGHETDPDSAYRWAIDGSAATVPSTDAELTTATQFTSPPLEDGVHYFHLTSQRPDGTISDAALHYEFRIDTTPPSAVPAGSATVIEPDLHVQLAWQDAVDAGSGVSHYRIYRKLGTPFAGRDDFNDDTILTENHADIEYVDSTVIAQPGFAWNYAIIPVDIVGNIQWENFLQLSTAPASTPTPTPTPQNTSTPTPVFTPTFTEGPSPTSTPSPTPAMSLSIAQDLNGNPGDEIVVPIHLTNAQAVLAVDLTVRFDPDVLTFTETLPVDLLRRFLIDQNDLGDGTVKISAFGTDEVDGVSGKIIELHFTISSQAANGSSTAVELLEVSINRPPLPVSVVNGLVTVGDGPAQPTSTPTNTPSGGTNPTPLAIDLAGFVANPISETLDLPTFVEMGSVPTDNAYPGATDGHGLRAFLQPGQGALLFPSAPVDMGAALMELSVAARVNSDQVALALVAIVAGPLVDGQLNVDGSLGYVNPIAREVPVNRWGRMRLLYDSPSSLIFPALQFVVPETAPAGFYEVYADTFLAGPYQEGRSASVALSADGTFDTIDESLEGLNPNLIPPPSGLFGTLSLTDGYSGQGVWMGLAPFQDAANLTLISTAPTFPATIQGTVRVKRQAGDDGTSFAMLVITDGEQSAGCFLRTCRLNAGVFQQLRVAGNFEIGGKETPPLEVIQLGGAGGVGDIVVDDLELSTIE